MGLRARVSSLQGNGQWAEQGASGKASGAVLNPAARFTSCGKSPAPRTAFPRSSASPGTCTTLFGGPVSIRHPCRHFGRDTPLRGGFGWTPPSCGDAQVRVTFTLAVLVYSLFNYTQSLKHLHDALKYSWPFLFNFICLLVFGDYPAKHSVNSIKFIPQLIRDPMTTEAGPSEEA